MTMTKHSEIAGLLEQRVRRGDYLTMGLPTEASLASEAEVSRTTARRALLELMDKGLLLRKPYGQLEVNREYHGLAGQIQVAFLAPAYSSPNVEQWRFAVERVAAKRNAIARVVDFVHWDDPIIPQTLAAFNGVFLAGHSEQVPPAMLSRLVRSGRVVALDDDFSDRGLPSVDLLPPVFIHQLGDHLYDLGHRHIDCLNTQPSWGTASVVAKRLVQWRFWRKMHKVQGRVINEPVQPYTLPIPQAYATMKRLLDAGEFKATALVCITDAAATGAIRALHEHGLVVGKDVSVCAVEVAGMARYQTPSRTTLESPDAGPYLEVCFDWFAKPDQPWPGPKLVVPANVSLFVGESTGPCGAVERGPLMR